MSTTQRASIDLAERVDALCDDFEAAWKAGQPRSIEECLQGLSPVEQPSAVAALVQVEAELRRRAGQSVDAQEYAVRFPQHTAEVRDALAQVQSTVDTSVSQQPEQTVTIDPSHPRPQEQEPVPATVGRFEVLGKIGEGAFGQVLKARDPQLDRLVAIKLPRRGTLSKPEDLERFLREAKTAATMHHPNICPVYEVGTSDGRPYIVMSLVPGKSLADHIKQSKEPMPIRQAVLIVRKLAQALELAHGKGIIHRDLKPANILVDRERKDVVIMDFGLARYERHDEIGLTVSGMVMGTPAYMSPEQARGDQKAIGPATDIYSLGVILHELLTRQRPFEGSMAEVLGKILHVEAPGPASARPEVDAQLDGIVRKCMAKLPRERFGSMKELAEALTAYLKQRSAAEAVSDQPAAATADGQSPGSRTTDDFLAAISSDLKDHAQQQRFETQAAIATAVKQARIPLWQWFAGAALFSALVLCGIIFFARTPTARVTIEIDVDLKDPELSFVLDNIAIPAANLAGEMELKVGRHELIVYRGEKMERRFVFDVKGGAKPEIAIKEDTGAPIPPPLPKLVVKPGEWTPLLEAKNPHEMWHLGKRAADALRFSPGRVEIQGFGMTTSRVKANNYVLKARLKVVGDGMVSLGGNGVAGKGSNQVSWRASGRLVLNKADLSGKDWHSFGAARVNPDAEGFVDAALGLYNGRLMMYSGDKLLLEVEDDEYQGGTTTISHWNSKGTDQGSAEVRDLQIFVLDGTELTPEDAVKLLAIDDAKDDGFESIFDGKTLEGWDGNPDFWSVKDGAITGTTTAAKPTRGNTYLIWRNGETADFELKFDYKIINGNSGVQYRSFEVPNKKWVVGGYQADFEAGETYSGSNYDERFRGVLADRGQKTEVTRTADGKVEVKVIEKLAESADLQKTIKKEDWNSCHIIAKGFEFTHIINGTTMSVCTDKDEKERRASGILALQLHAGPPMQVQFKNLRLKRLAGKKDPHRAAAEWVLRIGGRVRIATGGQEQDVTELPQTPFKVTSIDVSGRGVSDADLERLKGLTALGYLGLRFMPITDRGLANVRELTELWEVSLEGTKVTDAGLEHLQDQSKLRIVRLDEMPQITDAGIARLKGLDLHILGLNGTSVTDAGLEHLLAMNNLEYLWLGNTKVTDAGLAKVARLPSVKHLGLQGTKVTDAGLGHLKDLPLAHLSIQGTAISDAALKHVGSMPNMWILDLANTKITDAGLQHLEGLSKLGELNLSKTGVTDEGLRYLSTCPKLSRLWLDRTQVSDAGLVHLRGINQPGGGVWLNGTQVTGDGLRHLSELTELGELHLADTKLTDDSLEHLKGLKKLGRLALQGTQISDAGLAHLKALPELRELYLQGTNVTDAGVADLKAALPNCQIQR